MAEEFFLAACSPRRGGNSDFAASLLQQALPGRSTLRRVADCGVRPCISCGFCGENPGRCALDGPEDGAAALFDEMLRARFCIVVSPVYFYHIPAQAKAWVDRAQRFWACAERPGKGGILSAVLFLIQLLSQLRLQIHQLAGQRRLGQVQIVGRGRDILLPRNREKVTQDTKFHVSSSPC